MVPVDCPPGLEYLALIDQLIIKQKVILYSLLVHTSITSIDTLTTATMTIFVCFPKQIEALEAIAGVMGYGFETANKYKIKNSLGQVDNTQP